jgi:DnaJ-class molecular chaperone
MNQNQVPIKTTCNACGGEGVLATGQTFTLAGRDHPLLSKCVACDGKGMLLSWVDVHQLAQMLHAIAVEAQIE